MAFEVLSEKLQNVFKNLKSNGKLNNKNIQDALREIKLALLEADVNFKIVKDFINRISEKAIGEEVMKSLTPGQQVVKIVYDELIELMGGTQSKLTFSQKKPTIYMMVGLQGSGKTTTTGKLAGMLRKQGKSPLIVACDVYRAAAVSQLKIIGKNYNLPVFELEDEKNPIKIASQSLEYAQKNNNDIVIIDTAGRLHIDENLMDELKNMKEVLKPHEILLVVDAMTGQDAVNVAQNFDNALGIDGVIITKLDGDTRGGGTLSIRFMTGKPIKYVGSGEKIDDLEVFYPDRMVSRILGMGDVLSLIEKAQEAFDDEKAKELEKKVKTNDLNLNDFLEQMQQIKKMGSLKSLVNMMPGASNMLANTEIDDNALVHTEAIIRSMTIKERKKPNILNGSRKKRIANGSGRSIQEVNLLLKKFEEMRKLMKQLSDMGKNKKGKFNLPFFK